MPVTSDHPTIRLAMVLMGLALMLPCAAQELILVQDGEPRATIVLPATPTDKATVAAQDLQQYLAKMSGAVLPIVSEEDNPRGALVLVGPGTLARAFAPHIPGGLSNARREEGFIIRCDGTRLLLAGNDDGPYHGTEYAVYDFLNSLGVRWYMPGEFGEVVPTRSTITCPVMEVTRRPDFVMRNWWLHTTPELAAQERTWKIRNKMNPDPMFAIPGDSSARNILPESVYFKEHPEYFAMNPDGSRNPYMPNLTHPRAVEIAAGIIKDYFRQHPDANSYGFAPDDGLPRDYSPETVALNQGFVDLLGRPGVPAELSITEEWITFVNKVTAEVRREFPDVYIATNGYANRNLPPQGVELDDHLVIMFAAIWSCTLHAYDDPHCWQKVRQGELLRRWCELCDNVWIYGYNYQMLVSCLTPLPETRKLRRDFPLMKQWGVMGFMDETRNVWAESTIPSRYLRARLEWDADADVDAILDDFFTTWYGPAAMSMRGFYDSLEDSIQSSPLHGHEDRVLPFVYSRGLLEQLMSWLAMAEAAVGDAEPYRTRVQADRLIYEHLAAYMAMSEADAAGDFAAAARHAEDMMAVRAQLNAISPFFLRADEKRYESGVWYWGVLDRRDYYHKLSDMISGKTGRLVAMLPDTAQFRTDPHEDGIAGEWYKPGINERAWQPISCTRPFYIQGYADEAGHPYTGSIWYRFRVEVPPDAGGQKVLLYVPVVSTEAWCWVNGKYMGYRPYMEAYVRPCPMELDVTSALRPGETNQITIRVYTSLCASQAADGILSRPFLYSPVQQ